MVSQLEILKYLKKNEGWVTSKILKIHFNVDPSNLAKRLRKLNRYGFVTIIIDGNKCLIKYKEETDGIGKR
jgi:DNA-binding IscR family transcriptional regulator|tara:strand:+ start:451 stop:663 length:213 start_codon:yes stop_codon:yes gene_type:complete